MQNIRRPGRWPRVEDMLRLESSSGKKGITVQVEDVQGGRQVSSTCSGRRATCPRRPRRR